MEKCTSLADIFLFVNKTVNERSFPGSSNLSAVFDINVESDSLSNNALARNVFSPFSLRSTCKYVTFFSLAVWLILLQLSALLFVKGSFILKLFKLTIS